MSKPSARGHEAEPRKVRVPPRWFVTRAWGLHRDLHRLTGGHVGLWKPGRNGRGIMRLTTIGRRTGRDHSVFLAYVEDGSDLVAVAMNGWSEGHPAWWLNTQDHPDVLVETHDRVRAVTARAAAGAERARLWERWREIDKKLETRAGHRLTPTPVVIFSPRTSMRVE